MIFDRRTNVGVARDTLINEIDEADAVTHSGDCRDVADWQHGGLIDEFLGRRGRFVHEEERTTM